jgi:hypothetical protein
MLQDKNRPSEKMNVRFMSGLFSAVHGMIGMIMARLFFITSISNGMFGRVLSLWL